MSEATTNQRLDQLESDFDQFRADLLEMIHGSIKAENPGFASRIQSLESEINGLDIDKRLALLEDNRIKDGQLRVDRLEHSLDRKADRSEMNLVAATVATHSGWLAKIGGAVILAIVSALIGMVIQ